MTAMDPGAPNEQELNEAAARTIQQHRTGGECLECTSVGCPQRDWAQQWVRDQVVGHAGR